MNTNKKRKDFWAWRAGSGGCFLTGLTEAMIDGKLAITCQVRKLFWTPEAPNPLCSMFNV
jgi:hypothetical protein